MDFYKGTIPIIDHTPDALAYAMPTKIDGEKVGYGYVPRDYNEHPVEMFDPPSGLHIYQESEWDALYDEQEERESSLEHLYLSGPNGTPRFVNLDQNGHGYCWSYSTGSAMMMLDLIQNQPLRRLNPHSVAAIIKRGADQGGWWGLSAAFVREHGMAEEGTGPGQWPLHSRNTSLDTPAMREAMAKHKTLEEFVDLTRPVHSQSLSRLQAASALFQNLPGPGDYDWWGHSVCRIRWARIERGSWGPLILNSWPRWGHHGLGVLRGSQANHSGAGALRVKRAA